MVPEFLDALDFSSSVTGPIFLFLGLGAWLRRIGLINDAFIETGSRLIFNFTMPTLLFISISKTRLELSAETSLIIFGLVVTVLTWVATEATVRITVPIPADRDVVAQGIFRSNMAVIGLAYCVSAYGNSVLATAALYLGSVIIVLNVLSAVTFGSSLQRRNGPGHILGAVALSPLIIAIALALLVSISGIHLPGLLLQSGEYFGQMTLPLALLCTGAALDFRSLRHNLRNTLLATFGKLFFVPLVFVALGVLFGFQGKDLGILLLMSSAPSAAAGYAMVRTMGGNEALAANITVLTTVGSLLTTTAGLVILKTNGLI